MIRIRPALLSAVVVASGGLGLLASCASHAVNAWVKPGLLRPVGCLAVTYRLGPFSSSAANSQADLFASYIEQQTGPFLQYNAIPFCGVQRAPAGVHAGKASHLLRLVSRTGGFSYQTKSTSFNIEFELVDLAANEVVGR